MCLPVLNERAGSSPLPPLYAAWVDDLLDGAIPPETEATCDNCVMCESQSGDASPPLTGDRWFDLGTKCCTYVPLLPNDLVGRILLNDNPEMAPGVDSTRRRIEEGLAVTPLGLGRGTEFQVIYKSNPGEVFGRHAGLQCPHQRGDGMCGIWLHRNSVCATWFCKHSRGAAGIQFWSAILQLIEVVERDLTVWCVLQIGLDEAALTHLLNFREVALNDSGRKASQSDVQRWRQT